MNCRCGASCIRRGGRNCVWKFWSVTVASASSTSGVALGGPPRCTTFRMTAWATRSSRIWPLAAVPVNSVRERSASPDTYSAQRCSRDRHRVRSVWVHRYRSSPRRVLGSAAAWGIRRRQRMTRSVAPHWRTTVDRAMQRHNSAPRKVELHDPVTCVRCNTEIERRDSQGDEELVCRHQASCNERQRMTAFYKEIGCKADGSPM